jgi:hypothetical protein
MLQVGCCDVMLCLCIYWVVQNTKPLPFLIHAGSVYTICVLFLFLSKRPQLSVQLNVALRKQVKDAHTHIQPGIPTCQNTHTRLRTILPTPHLNGPSFPSSWILPSGNRWNQSPLAVAQAATRNMGWFTPSPRFCRVAIKRNWHHDELCHGGNVVVMVS